MMNPHRVEGLRAEGRHSKASALAVAFLWLVGLPLLAASPDPPEAVDRSRPNIVYILLDDLHYDDLGSYGGTAIRTPHIDRLAREGMRFTQYYANGPVCSPTRVALLTGRYPHHFNMKYVVRQKGYPGPRWRSGPSGRGIPGYVTTLAEILDEQGYETIQIAKWHAGKRLPEYRPIHQGFDHSVLSLASPTSVHRDVVMLVDDETRVKTHGHLTDVATDYALRFLRDVQGEPFFLNLWYVSPHTPLEPPPRWAERYPDSDLGRYAAMVSHVDEQIGRIVEALDAGSTRGQVDFFAEGRVDARLQGGAMLLRPDPLVDFHDGDFSFAVWVRLPRSPEAVAGTIAAKPESWRLHLDSDRIPRLWAAGEETEDDTTELVGGPPLAPGTWHHVAFTVRGSINRNSEIRLYVDGELRATNEELLAFRPGGDEVVLGAAGDAMGTLLTGDLAGLRMYLMDLSAEEMGTLVASGPPAGLTSEPKIESSTAEETRR